MDSMTVNNELKEEKNEKFSNRAYSMHFNYPMKIKALMTLLAFMTLGIGWFFVQGESVSWYLKGGIALIYSFFVLKKFYDIKYYLGVKKNLFVIDKENNSYSYFNEFEGVKTFKLSDMKRIKIFRNKGGIHLIEIITTDGKREQNINVSCLTQKDINDMVMTLRSLYPEVEFAENLPPYEVAKAQKEAERTAKKEEIKNKKQKK